MPWVLIVDDDASMAQTLADMVGLFDWDTTIVNSPRAAMETLHRSLPGLILLDMNMPGVNGLEVCRYIKRDPMAGSTPVIFVTAEDDPATRERAKEAGAMDYLIKPVDMDRLEAILEKLVKESGPTLKSSPPPPAAATQAAKETKKPALDPTKK